MKQKSFDPADFREGKFPLRRLTIFRIDDEKLNYLIPANFGLGRGTQTRIAPG
jgi:hypothetical protein